MFERFTTEARAAVVAARTHAVRLGHPRVGTEHLLLALAELDPTTAAALAGAGLSPASLEAAIVAHVGRPLETDRAALAALGIDLDRVRDAVDVAFGPGALLDARHSRRNQRGRHAGTGRFSARARKVLELSLREALRLKQRSIDTEHLALAILREGRGLACLILAEHHVPTDELRDRLESAHHPA